MMISYRQETSRSWVKYAPSVRGLATLLTMVPILSVRALIIRLHQIETVDLRMNVVTPEGFPLGGWVQFTLRSDGTYQFQGNMRATGFTSYHYGLQAFVRTPDGVLIAAQHTGRVFGTDTPGDRNNTWDENGRNMSLPDRWRSVRSNSTLAHHLNADISGVLGTGWDILKVAVEAIVANAALGVGGLIIVVGSELSAALGVRSATPDKFLGVAVAGGVVLVIGPGIMLPAIVGGVVVAAISDIRHRAMTEDERRFAAKVFGDKLPFDRITLTNLSQGGGRKYAIPSFDGSILVNLDDAYDHPMTYSKARSDYTQPGSVFIHELTHAWQIANTSFLPGLICGLSDTYDYHTGEGESGRLVDRSWSTRPWNSFNLEQQAHIVDDWYGTFHTNLNSSEALNDPAFRFISNNIRAGSDD